MKILLLIAPFLIGACSSAQQISNQNKIIDIPDSIRARLVEFLELDQKEKGEALYIFNLTNKQSTSFVNGLYAFKQMGPHFQRRLFIYHNKQFYIFRNYPFNAVLLEFANYLTSSTIELKDKIKYLSGLSEYLKEEYDSER